jgi:hypothetical protein
MAGRREVFDRIGRLRPWGALIDPANDVFDRISRKLFIGRHRYFFMSATYRANK